MKPEKKRVIRYLQDALIVSCVGSLLYYGAIWRVFNADVSIYQCYAVAFWQGWSGFQKLPPGQCMFIIDRGEDQGVISQNNLLLAMQQRNLSIDIMHFFASQRPDHPYHTLPSEYPVFAVLPLSLGLIAPTNWYRYVFAIEMLLLVGCIYVALRCWRSRGAALACCLYLLVGAFSTLAARFDIVPAALTLFAVICAQQKRWNWAFAFLALATLSKLYPLILLVPFLLAQQRAMQGKWYTWRRWQPMALFVGICVFVVVVSLLLNLVGTLAPLAYFDNRPAQIESLAASFIWMASLLSKTSLTYIFSFGSINVLSLFSLCVTFLMNVPLVVGLYFTWRLQWQRRIGLAMTCLLTLLIVMVLGKVFSPQYLIWVIPLVAYVGQSKRRWLFFWILVGLLTTWIYPFIYNGLAPLTFLAPYLPLLDLNGMGGVWRQVLLVSAVRNLLLLGFIVVVLASRSFLSHPVSRDKKWAERDKQHRKKPQVKRENPQQDLVEASETG